MRTIGRRKTDKVRMAIGMIVGAALLVTIGITSRCNKGDSISGPSETVAQQPAPVAAPAPQQPQAVDPTPDPNKPNLVPVTFDNSGGYHIQNDSGIAQEKGACLFQVYDGGEQQLRGADPLKILISAGAFIDGSFDLQPKRCYQGDIIPGGATCKNFQHADAAYYKDGKKVAHFTALVGCNIDCKVGEWGYWGPWSEWAPHPTKQGIETRHRTRSRKVIEPADGGTACPGLEETEYEERECPWRELEPIVRYGDWSECREGQIPEIDFQGVNNEPPTTQCRGVKQREKTVAIFEINACTEEKRLKSKVTTTDYASCEYECLKELCHTQNDKWCGWAGCQNHWYIGATKKWQCQNVPPGTPGHYPNHFDANSHDDFFGVCVESKCYSITN